MGKGTDVCLCVKCNEKRKVGKNATLEIDGDMYYIVCNVCGSELFNYKVAVKKSRNTKSNHKAKN